MGHEINQQQILSALRGIIFPTTVLEHARHATVAYGTLTDSFAIFALNTATDTKILRYLAVENKTDVPVLLRYQTDKQTTPQELLIPGFGSFRFRTVNQGYIDPSQLALKYLGGIAPTTGDVFLNFHS